MIRENLSTTCVAVLCLLSAAWIYFSFTTRLKVEMTMRRQLQTFEERLKTTVRIAPPEFRALLTQTSIIADKDKEVVILGTLPEETFEEMRLRISQPLLFPMWPGIVSLVLGGVCILATMLSPNAAKNA